MSNEQEDKKFKAGHVIKIICRDIQLPLEVEFPATSLEHKVTLLNNLYQTLTELKEQPCLTALDVDSIFELMIGILRDSGETNYDDLQEAITEHCSYYGLSFSEQNFDRAFVLFMSNPDMTLTISRPPKVFVRKVDVY